MSALPKRPSVATWFFTFALAVCGILGFSAIGSLTCSHLAKWLNPSSLKSAHHEVLPSSGRLLVTIERYLSQNETGAWDSTRTDAVLLDTNNGREIASHHLDDREEPIVHTPGVLWTAWNDRSRLKAYDFRDLSTRFDSKGKVALAASPSFARSEDSVSLVFTTALGRRSRVDLSTGQVQDADEPGGKESSTDTRPDHEGHATLSGHRARWGDQELRVEDSKLVSSNGRSLGTFFAGRLVTREEVRETHDHIETIALGHEDCVFVMHQESLAPESSLRVTKLHPATGQARWTTALPEQLKAEAAFLEPGALLVVASGKKGAVSVTSLGLTDGALNWRTKP